MLPSPPTRRQFLGATAGLGLALAGCGRRREQLRIFVYAGGHEKTMREVFVPAFEQETGAQVVLDPGWWDSVPKLKAAPAGQPPFDLVVIDATQGYPAIKDGLFQTIDLANVPNHKLLTPAVLDNWVFKDGYGIPFPDSVMTLASHKKLVPFRPSRWSDLLRDEVRGKVALYNSFYMSLYTFACMKVDSEGRAGSAAEEINKNIDGVLKFAKANRERVKFWWPTSNEMIVALAHKDCALGNMHSPEMLTALRERPELGAIVPDADRAFVQVAWVIPVGTKRKALAEAAINLIFSEDMQREFAKRGSATAVLSAAKATAAEDKYWGQIYPSTEQQFKTLRYYPYDAYFRDWDGISKAWDREVLRKG